MAVKNGMDDFAIYQDMEKFHELLTKKFSDITYRDSWRGALRPASIEWFKASEEEISLVLIEGQDNTRFLLTSKRVIWKAGEKSASADWIEIEWAHIGTKADRNRLLELAREKRNEYSTTFRDLEIELGEGRRLLVHFDNNSIVRAVAEIIRRIAHRNNWEQYPQWKKDGMAMELPSTQNRHALEVSTKCGCFHCMQIFEPTAIVAWIDQDNAGQGQTAICPNCNFDSVLADSSGITLTNEYLSELHRIWFAEYD